MSAPPVHRVIYVSRSRIGGTEARLRAEIDAILAVARPRNAADGVTGALLFTRTGFAQVLEGPLAAVQATFERIQRDPRHDDVLVLASEPVGQRLFAGWAMADAGLVADTHPLLSAATPAAAPVLALLRDLAREAEHLPAV